MLQKGKMVFVCLVALISIGVTARTFWTQDLQYALPTPVPASWKAVPSFTRPNLPVSIVTHIMQGAIRPTLLNFFNPDCPCSQFNLEHVRALTQRYGTHVRCITILETADGAEAPRTFRSLHLAGDYMADTDGSIAAACGVYSTPQAVVLDGEGRLIYCGNYNSGRYCTEPQSEFVRLTLDAFLAHATLPPFSKKATRAYGCALPGTRIQEYSR